MAEDDGDPVWRSAPNRSSRTGARRSAGRAGKEARAKVPRELNATFEPGPDRPDPVSLLEEQAKSRVQELVPIRYGRMLVSPFTFFRGAALIMASDLSTTPCSGLTAQLCGDAHLSNFGVFGTPERRLIFDCNDFDETHPGPVGVGRQAAGGERRDRRPHQGPPQGGAGPGDRGAGPDVPGVDAPDGHHVEPGGLVLPRGRVGGRRVVGVPGGHLGLEETGADGGDGDEAGGQGADEGQPCGHSTS